MRINIDPNVANYEYRRNPRAALKAAIKQTRRANQRAIVIGTVACVAVIFAEIVGRFHGIPGGVLVLVGLLGAFSAIASALELEWLSEGREGQWEFAHIEERYVWKTTDVRDDEGAVTENFLYVIAHAPKSGERVADPHALGKMKYPTGPGVLWPELIRVGGHLDRMAYLGRTITLATSHDGRVTAMLLAPELALTRLDGPPVPAIPRPR